MNFSIIKNRLSKAFKTMVLLATIGASLSSCEKMWEGEGDCTRGYKVRFTYTMNMLMVDAFSTKVNSISLFVFDKSGALVYSASESDEALRRDDYYMLVDVEPGTYDLIVWAGLGDGDRFKLVGGVNPLTKEDLICIMERDYDEDDAAFSKTSLNSLFHGMQEDVVFPEGYGQTVDVATIDLTKNTNTIRLVLFEKNGRILDHTNYHFRVYENNGTMNFDNSLLDDEHIEYHQWLRQSTKIPTPYFQNELKSDSIDCVVAEIDVARMMMEQNPILTVLADDKSDPIITFSLINLLLVAKGETYSFMDNQEFLNRQDDYTIFFQLDDNNNWYIPGGIYVNGWKVVMQDAEI